MSDIELGKIKAQIEKYVWFHSIDLGNGIITPGGKSTEILSAEYRNTFSNIDVRGKSLLDVGAWNGAFSVEAARRGASRVVALDNFTWNRPDLLGRETFDLVNRLTGLNLEAVDIDLDAPQLSLAHLGHFDIVLFLGVFYHLQNPVSALRELAALTREVLILETHIEVTADTRPSMIFYPNAELAGDPTNWWGPNVACVVELLKMVGFCRVEASAGYASNRGVFHAFRT